ncbi:MAG: sulfatase [Planctomycetota bacterium]
MANYGKTIASVGLVLLFHAIESPDVALAAGRKPNVVLIVADDLGYADLGFQGGKEIPTPNLDGLAKGGVVCTNGYVTCPVCSPTRAGLLTGRYQQRFGHEYNPGNARVTGAEVGLPMSQGTLPSALKADGYKTGMVGKWHLGVAEKFRPTQRGFDEFYGFLGGAHQYTDLEVAGVESIYRGNTPISESEYLTDAFAREATDFINRHATEPFFLYLPFNAVHTPMQATNKYLDRFKSIENEKRRSYAAMLSAMDDAVGAVLTRIHDLKLEDDTLVFFISDNGGPPSANASNNGPLHGAKGSVWEGGIRVPFVVRWPSRVPAGKTYDKPVISLDIFPTILAAAGVSKPEQAKFDGVNLLPFLSGEKQESPHDRLYWRFGSQHALRQGNWKLVHVAGESDKLYDLVADLGETKNLATEKPETLSELQKAYASWNSELVEPLWQRQEGGKRAAGARMEKGKRPGKGANKAGKNRKSQKAEPQPQN